MSILHRSCTRKVKRIPANIVKRLFILPNTTCLPNMAIWNKFLYFLCEEIFLVLVCKVHLGNYFCTKKVQPTKIAAILCTWTESCSKYEVYFSSYRYFPNSLINLDKTIIKFSLSCDSSKSFHNCPPASGKKIYTRWQSRNRHSPLKFTLFYFTYRSFRKNHLYVRDPRISVPAHWIWRYHSSCMGPAHLSH